jgi:hypothetical protein
MQPPLPHMPKGTQEGATSRRQIELKGEPAYGENAGVVHRFHPFKSTIGARR